MEVMSTRFKKWKFGSETLRMFWPVCGHWWWPNWNTDIKTICDMGHCRDTPHISFEDIWIHELLWCLGALQLNGLHFHLQFSAQMHQNWPILFKEKCQPRKNWLYITNWSEENVQGKNHFVSEEGVDMVGLEGYCILWAPPVKSGIQSGQLPSPFGPIKRQQSLKSIWNWSIGRMLFHIRAMTDYISLCRHSKIWYRLAGISYFYLLYSPDIEHLEYHLFWSLQIFSSILWKPVKII